MRTNRNDSVNKRESIARSGSIFYNSKKEASHVALGGLSMRKRMKYLYVAALAVVMLLLCGCKTVSNTILNSESKIFYGGCQIEANVRELSVDGGKTTARIRFTNLGGDSLDALEALVEFVDADGNTIASDVISLTFDSAVEAGENFSATAKCDSDDRIVGVVVSSYSS